ncbi:hypothetical protein [Pseudomonas germanica]|uniref:Uncharacterized protein n=1 Tax=Pseudomonas germanica TaxID=2815720 RepID=A0ABX8YS54_9PSED|nr:hypothetical protein [Pseudomonas germanica]QYY82791.1 hypothetical protein J0G10_04890 [Pseudomonas germanica]
MSHHIRFAEACKDTDFNADPSTIGGYIVWTVQHVRDGERVEIEGPFFTEEEARISAELMRIEYRGARAYKSTHCSAWNPDEKREIAIRDDAMATRMILAGQLGMQIHEHSAQSAQE